MKILLMNSDDGCGGAARAAFRLHKGLQAGGTDSHLLVQKKYSDDKSVRGPVPFLGHWIGEIRPHLDALPSCLYPRRTRALFSSAILPERLTKTITAIQPDIIHLHWICNGFVTLNTLRHVHRPIVWTLHDMWPFTGGCHYSGGCDSFRAQCGMCPQLGSSSNNDLSYWNWRRKMRAFQEIQVTIISPSRWLAECARASTLFRHFPVEVIPNGIDTVRFAPRDKKLCRAILGLPQNRVILLAGGIGSMNDGRKGMYQLIAALKQIAPGVEIAIMGASAQVPPIEFGMPVHYLGHLHDDVSLAVAYAAADIFVSSSLEENLSNMVMEAAACGVPTVAFQVGGMPDLVDTDVSGILVPLGSVNGLAEAINALAGDRALRINLGLEARSKVEREFAIEKIVQRHIQVYERII